MKHILALTYEPKIPDVRNGKCTQTIRPCSQRPRRKNDWIMFHGWEGKPYNSKWSFRTPYWKIIEVIPIHIDCNEIIVNPWLDTERTMTLIEADDLARKDGFDYYHQMYKQFKQMYGNRLMQMIFEVIRWNYNEYKLEDKEPYSIADDCWISKEEYDELPDEKKWNFDKSKLGEQPK